MTKNPRLRPPIPGEARRQKARVVDIDEHSVFCKTLLSSVTMGIEYILACAIRTEKEVICCFDSYFPNMQANEVKPMTLLEVAFLAIVKTPLLRFL